MNKLLLLILAGMTIAPNAYAQLGGTDSKPGDACTAAEEGHIRRNASADRDISEITLICDGTTWQSATGGGFAALQGQDNPGPCTEEKDGIIRYNAQSDPQWEYCHGGTTSWLPFRLPQCQNDGTGACTLSALRSINDPQLKPSSIRCGDNILGIVGTYGFGSASNFTFSNVTNAALSTLTTAPVITISGIPAGCPAEVAVSGQGTPQISIAGGAWGTSGVITNGQTLAVRLTSSPTLATAHAATISIGSTDSVWTVTTIPPDTTPNAFTFTDQTNVAQNALISSNSVTIAGINTGTPVSVSGEGSPQISINGGAWSTSGTIQNGQTLQVRLTSSAAAGTSSLATVDVGGITTQWSVTTVGPDTVPNAFTFTDVVGAPVSTLTTSNSITINGINTSTPVSVSGGGSPQISIAGGAWVTAGNITNGQSLQVRLTSSATYTQSLTATVDVGGVTDSWSVTTGAVVQLNGTYRQWSNGTFAVSCNDYRNPPTGYVYTGDTGTGTYRIDIDGTGGAAAFDAYCDMTTGGGGWTRIINGSGTTVAELAKFGSTSQISGTFGSATAGIKWGTNDNSYKSYILNIPFSSYKITYSGTYTGGMGWLTVGTAAGSGDGIGLYDAWNANSGGQSLYVNGSAVFDESQTNVSDRTDTINRNDRYVGMKGYTSSYTYNPRYIKYLWVK